MTPNTNTIAQMLEAEVAAIAQIEAEAQAAVEAELAAIAAEEN